MRVAPFSAGEVVERPHDVDDELGVRPRERVDRVVGMQALRDLAGADLDAGRRAELVVAEHRVEHAEDQRVRRGAVHDARLREQRVDAAGVEPLERVAPEGRLRGQGRELGSGGAGFGERVGHDRIAVAVEVGKHPGEFHVVHGNPFRAAWFRSGMTQSVTRR